MKRMMCLWFPNWPIQRRFVAKPLAKSQPLILHELSRGKLRVAACCRRARQHGVKLGMTLAEAQALCPTILRPSPPLRGRGDGGEGVFPCFEPYDLNADREALRQLAQWGQQFSPHVAVEEAEFPDSLLLDVTGCGYGFGGEEGLIEKAIASLRQIGYCAVAAIADTIGAAWAMAHFSQFNSHGLSVGWVKELKATQA